MEGCDHCSNYQYGCCEDELTPAYGPNMEVNRSLSIIFFFFYLRFLRAVVVTVPDMVAAWMEAQPQVRTIWVV